MSINKLKVSLLLKETGAFVLTYGQGVLMTKEGSLEEDEEKKALFAKTLNDFEDRDRMFKFLSDAKNHLNSPKPSVGFFVRESEDPNLIEVTRLYFIIGICTSMVPMEGVDYKLFFEEFFDLEGRKIVVKDPKN